METGMPSLFLSLSVQFSLSVMSNSLLPSGLQPARVPCPSSPPIACIWSIYSCISSHWCHPTISSSVIHFSSHLQSFQYQGLLNESVLCIRWQKYWSFIFSISPSSEHPGLISFRMDWLDLLAVQGTLKSLLQHHSLKHHFPRSPPTPGRLTRATVKRTLRRLGASRLPLRALRPPQRTWPQECKLPTKYVAFFMTWKFGSAPRQKKSRKERRLSSSVSVQTKSASSWRKAKEILVGDVGVTITDPFKHFVGMLPEKDCRYALYDASFETKESRKEELMFFLWAPELAPLKSKMIYASSKDAIKKKFQGIKQECQANGARRPQSGLYCWKARWIPNCSFWRMPHVDHHQVPQIESFHI